MKKVINGKLYDTEKAVFIASYRYSNPSDFKHIEEDLYKTKKGNYFLAGGGGPMSKYAVSLGDNQTGGSSDVITPLTAQEAREWCESREVDADIITREFDIEEA
ncbi:MAG: hypothetical protein D5R97_09295 [Candidatus Syntrophonatronum acetioxidans]|uniref:Uncharacterized protein n=1 Tax=Candidatus Syntrophonatronum acetioxidans TaxID=1795816 RepID=A0A424YA87_9FIRM|nr:MAG: hypothetical protein D5R97_09295 [Candidatus Syntrophonatronum acetioxidans]